MVTEGEEDRFLCEVRRKVTHCSNLFLSGNQSAEVIIRYVYLFSPFPTSTYVRWEPEFKKKRYPKTSRQLFKLYST